MNVVFGDKEKEKEGPAVGGKSSFRSVLLLDVAAVLVGIVLAAVLPGVNRRPDVGEGVESSEVVEKGLDEAEVVAQVADSLGVPSVPAVRLCWFLAEGGFSGVGLFKVKSGHVGWLGERFVPGAEVDLEDPVMNANVALGLIASFHGRGYSWGQAFLIYVFGWGELAPASRSAEAEAFLAFVFDGEAL
jgi:hypothetical protein